MFHLIALDYFEFSMKLMLLQAAAGNLSPYAGALPEATSRAEALNEYRGTLGEISTMLEQYKSLLQKDTLAIAQVRADMLETDNTLASGMKAN